MANNKENLKKLLKFIDEISNEKGNEWFKNELTNSFSKKDYVTNSKAIDEIYEYCIQKIIKEHAEKFYSEFKFADLTKVLIDDFIQMEQFRRVNNFEDFCMAAYQQFEAIVNKLFSETIFVEYIKMNIETPALFKYDNLSRNFIREVNGKQTIGKLIFQTSDINQIKLLINKNPNEWYFLHKFRAVLYCYYFNKELRYTTNEFDKIYEMGNYLHQGRNLNHRGAQKTKKQQDILDNIMPNQHRYFFKFLGFLEDFTTKINSVL